MAIDKQLGTEDNPDIRTIGSATTAAAAEI